ncbi:hypothetical protein EDC01DRAFT_104277 [Geopyxis carbonaria]|nr:hypothetical protein EDC01DRAFT_104277 [Geopyxis carbonaria]
MRERRDEGKEEAGEGGKVDDVTVLPPLMTHFNETSFLPYCVRSASAPISPLSPLSPPPQPQLRHFSDPQQQGTWTPQLAARDLLAESWAPQELLRKYADQPQFLGDLYSDQLQELQQRPLGPLDRPHVSLVSPPPEARSLPASRPDSPYNLFELTPADLHWTLPASSFNSPTLLPHTVPLPDVDDALELEDESLQIHLPASAPGSPYHLFSITPADLHWNLPASPWDSPTLLPRPTSCALPSSIDGLSPYQLPEVSKDLPSLPGSPWDSPTIAPRPTEASLPSSWSGSPYSLAEIQPRDVPELPESRWNSPTLGPKPTELYLPLSRPGSPYSLASIAPRELPILPESRWNSPTLGPKPTEKSLPVSRPGSPYTLSELSPVSLPQLPSSPWNSPTLGPRPTEKSLPISRPGSPYSLASIAPRTLPKLPASPWNSPTLGPRPTETLLPVSHPSSPWSLAVIENDLPQLPSSPWNSPTLGPRPTESLLPLSKPGSPYSLATIAPASLPYLPASPWNSPTLGPRPTEKSLPVSRPGSPYSLSEIAPADLHWNLPHRHGTPQPWGHVQQKATCPTAALDRLTAYLQLRPSIFRTACQTRHGTLLHWARNRPTACSQAAGQTRRTSSQRCQRPCRCSRARPGIRLC